MPNIHTPAPALGAASNASVQTITHYENFPVASWLCPAALRAPITAIYHFARTADDIADEGTANMTERLATLQAYRAALQAACLVTTDLRTCTAVHPTWLPVFSALQLAITHHTLPVPLLHDLLDAFVQDTEKSGQRSGYADEAQLLDYCRRSANPVGRLLLHLYGVRDDISLQQSDAICSALQLINFWQDLSVDIPRGRYYLPTAVCKKFGYAELDMRACCTNTQAIAVVRHCVIQARTLMQQGAPLVHSIPGRAGWELRLVVQGGLRILKKIEAVGFSTLRHRPIIRWWDAPIIVWHTLWM